MCIRDRSYEGGESYMPRIYWAVAVVRLESRPTISAFVRLVSVIRSCARRAVWSIASDISSNWSANK